MKSRILIVEDNKYMLQYFEELIKKDDDFILAGSLKDADQVEYFCYLNDVDAIMMDVQTLHGHSGLKAAKNIKASNPDIKIIAVTSLVDNEVLNEAKMGYVDSLWYKDHGDKEVTDIIKKTLNGKTIFPEKAPNVEIGRAFSNEISDTQKEILRLYIQGNSYSEIAKKLYFEEATVKYHMNQMIKKCGFHSKQELIAAAIDSTIITNLSK